MSYNMAFYYEIQICGSYSFVLCTHQMNVLKSKIKYLEINIVNVSMT